MSSTSDTATNAKGKHNNHYYPIGTLGQPWNDEEKMKWRNTRMIQRSYHDEVLNEIFKLKGFNVQQYGALSQDPQRYPLYSVSTRGDWKTNSKPCVLITGGVHGYETSGVQGALLFIQEHAHKWEEQYNILVVPCVSPWGYETIQRWNCQAVDPNRSFNPNGEIVVDRPFNPEAATEESAALIQHLQDIGIDENRWLCHLDLHETTDTDETEFTPAKAARDGLEECPPDSIPDGFYLVSDSTLTSDKTVTDWYSSMIEAVKQVTHIAPTDPDGTIVGETVVQEGVIAIPSPKLLGLCASVTGAKYATTTEVYPDSPTATPEICNKAQVACIEGALKHLLEKKEEKDTVRIRGAQ